MKFTPLSSNPYAISSISSLERKYSLPKETNTTEEFSFLSNHSISTSLSSSLSSNS
ncbi:hypothetical protein LguiA_012390 [Lonicera macranthoides]